MLLIIGSLVAANAAPSRQMDGTAVRAKMPAPCHLKCYTKECADKCQYKSSSGQTTYIDLACFTLCRPKCMKEKCPNGNIRTGCNKFCFLVPLPVCGSDGKTYSNQCELENAQCDQPDLTKKHDGGCLEFQTIDDSHAAARQLDGCKTGCPFLSSPVCGSDGLTYPNICVLRNARCDDPSLTKEHDGACSDDPCSLPKVVGPCRAAFRKYYFNSATGKCTKFIYGGCGGNANRFDTKEECQERCEDSDSDTDSDKDDDEDRNGRI